MYYILLIIQYIYYRRRGRVWERIRGIQTHPEISVTLLRSVRKNITDS